MKLVKIQTKNLTIESAVKTQAEARGFEFVEYKDNMMVFKKDNGNIESIKNLKHIPGLGEYIDIFKEG